MSYTTIDQAVTATRNLLNSMATSIKTLKGSSTAINGQNIPNEIRALKGESSVVKTYDNITDYLTDIGQILLPDADRSPGQVINAQNFPTLILQIDENYQKYAQLMNWSRINSTMLPYSVWQTFSTTSNTKFGKGNWDLYAVYANSSSWRGMSIGSVAKGTAMTYAQMSSYKAYGNEWWPTNGQQGANYTNVYMSNHAFRGDSSQIFTTSSVNQDGYIYTPTDFYGYGMTFDKISITS